MKCPRCGSENIITNRQLLDDPPIPIGFCPDCGAEWVLLKKETECGNT